MSDDYLFQPGEPVQGITPTGTRFTGSLVWADADSELMASVRLYRGWRLTVPFDAITPVLHVRDRDGNVYARTVEGWRSTGCDVDDTGGWRSFVELVDAVGEVTPMVDAPTIQARAVLPPDAGDPAAHVPPPVAHGRVFDPGDEDMIVIPK